MNKLLLFGVILLAQVDPIEPCCRVVSINTQTGVVTARVNKTGQTFTLTDLVAADLGRFKVGAAVDLMCAVPPSGGTGATGNAASGATGTTSGGGSACGSNVGRYANTKTAKPRPAGDCFARSGGHQVEVACPTGVPIKPAK